MSPSLSYRVVASAIAAIVLGLALVSAARAADPVFPAGSRVGLVPPPGLMPATTFQGFEDPRLRVALVVTELSARSYADLVKDFSPDEMRAGGMQEESRENVTLREGAGFIVVARAPVGGVAVRKWALVATFRDLIAVVLIVVPEAAREAYPDAVLRAALATVTVRPKVPIEQQLALLPYRFGDLGGFRVVRARPDGMALLTFGPDDAATAEEQPFMMVLTQAAEIPAAAERDAFARRVLANAWPLANARFVRSAGIRIGTAPAHEIVVETRSAKTSTDFTAVQWLLFGSGSYLQIVGAARRELWDEIWPRMHKVREGIVPK